MLMQSFKAIPNTSPKLLNLKQDLCQKRNRLFWSNPYKDEVKITSLIETVESLNFGHMTTSTVCFDSRDKSVLVTSWTKIMTF